MNKNPTPNASQETLGEWRQSASVPRGHSLLVLLCLLLIAVICCFASDRWYQKYLIGEQRASAASLLNMEAFTLSVAINRRLAKLEGLHAFAEANTLAADFGKRFDDYAAGLYAGADDVSTYAVTRGGVVRYVYPAQGRETALGVDLLRDPRTREDALRALRSRSVTLSAPFELLHGGVGVAARKVVFSNGQFWGFAVLALDIPATLAQAGLERQDRLDVTLRDESFRIFHGDPRIFQKSPVIFRIGLPEGYWELAAIPKGGWEASIRRDLLAFRAMSGFLAFCLVWIIFQMYDRQRRMSSAIEERTAALSESEAVIRRQYNLTEALIDSVPGVLYLYDQDLHFLRWNKNFERVSGYTAEEIVQLNPLDFFSDADKELLGRRIAEVFATGASNVEAVLVSKDGSRIPYTFTGIRVEIGEKTCLIGIGIDITERKRVEEDLVESERKFRTLFEQAAVGIAEIDPVSGRFLDVNKRYCDILGLSKEAMLHTDFQSITHPDDLEADLSNLRALLRGEKTEYSMDKRYVRKDGEIIWVGLTVYPIWLVGEKPTHHIAIIVDITEKKKVESALQYSEEKFSKAFHATPSGIVISRASDGLVFEVNEAFCRMFEFSRGEVVGRTSADLHLWADQHDRTSYAAAVQEHGCVRGVEAPFRASSGRLLDGLVFGEKLELAGEQCLLTVIRDITELKKADAEIRNYRLHLEELVEERTEELKAANDKLKELDRLKSMFIASMSHELRTPLNAIIGFTGITIQGLSGELSDQQKENLLRVYRAAKHLLSLITDVIDISKIEAGRIDSYPEAVSLECVVDEAVGAVTPQLEEKGLDLVTEVPALMLTTDRTRLLQCLLNLLSNAVKYTESGTISVAARETESEVAVSVTDTGIGIAEEDQPNVFQAFERFDTHLRVKAGGTGLGLYLTRKIAREILHGDVVFRSKEGEGSVFTVTVPKHYETKPD